MFRFAGWHLPRCGAHGESLSSAVRRVRRSYEPAEADPEEERVVPEGLTFDQGCKGRPAAAEGPLDSM